MVTFANRLRLGSFGGWIADRHRAVQVEFRQGREARLLEPLARLIRTMIADELWVQGKSDFLPGFLDEKQNCMRCRPAIVY
jgi:hypothetical protein